VENDPALFGNLLDKVTKTAPKELTPVFGLKDTEGLGEPSAKFLLKSKHIAKESNPAKVDHERERSCHPDKSDPQDAFRISKALADEFFSLPSARENSR